MNRSLKEILKKVFSQGPFLLARDFLGWFQLWFFDLSSSWSSPSRFKSRSTKEALLNKLGGRGKTQGKGCSLRKFPMTRKRGGD